MSQTSLFDTPDLFHTGSHNRILQIPDAHVVHRDGFFNKSESDYYYRVLLDQTPWQQYQMPMYGKVVAAPRMIAWYQDQEVTAPGSVALEFTQDLDAIRKRVEAQTTAAFNAVMLNLYRNGADGVSWHSDKTGRTGPDPIIASVTFGQTRIFRMRHKTRRDIPIVEIPLHHGSFLLMAGTTNSYWEHQIPKTSRSLKPRINLTFRQLRSDLIK